MAEDCNLSLHFWSSLNVAWMARSISSAVAGRVLPSVGNGRNAAMAFDTGLMRFAGMTFPGNGSRMNPDPFGFGRVVSGSKIVTPLLEKSPFRSAAVGRKSTLLPAVFVLYPSAAAQKNVLSLLIGPPREPP